MADLEVIQLFTNLLFGFAAVVALITVVSNG